VSYRRWLLWRFFPSLDMHGGKGSVVALQLREDLSPNQHHQKKTEVKFKACEVNGMSFDKVSCHRSTPTSVPIELHRSQLDRRRTCSKDFPLAVSFAVSRPAPCSLVSVSAALRLPIHTELLARRRKVLSASWLAACSCLHRASRLTVYRKQRLLSKILLMARLT
jgi:hypothetical protein